MGALRIHAFWPSSRANGPGRRAVLWLQGCTLACPGCFNGPTHPLADGSLEAVPELLRRVIALAPEIDGLSVSGGEPLQQAGPLAELLEGVRRETDLSIWLFSGFSLGEIERIPAGARVLAAIDVLLAGRYQAGAGPARGLLAPGKKAHFLTGRHHEAELAAVPPAEIRIGPDGTVTASGIEAWKGHQEGACPTSVA